MKITMCPVLMVGTLFVTVGCSSGGKPVTQEQFTEVEATIRSAESVGAFQHAPTLLQKARQMLGAGQQASGKGDHLVVHQRLLEATAYAEAARARAQAEQQSMEAALVLRQAGEIERKAEAIKKQLQIQ